MQVIFLLIVVQLSEFYCHQFELKEEFYWGKQNFKFPNASARNVALATGSYIPANNNIFAIQVWNEKIFVSVFRLKVGVPSGFNYFSMNCATKSPVLIPYPSFDANYISEDPMRKTLGLPCDSSIISTAYFRIDKCDRLWISDAGLIDFFGERRELAPPALVIFKLKTDSLIRRFIIPAAFVNSNTGFVSLEIDFKGNGCNDAYAYVVDLDRSIVVYSLKTNRVWRLSHNFFRTDLHAVNFSYEGIKFQWCYGILGITVGEHHRDGSRQIYLKPFSSTKTYYISNKILQNETYIALNKSDCDVHLLGDRGKNGHIYSYAYDEKTNVLFDVQFIRKRVGCWNSAKPYTNSSFGIVYKSNKLFFPVDVHIDRNRNLWMVSNNYPIFAYGTWNENAKNVRIFKANVDKVISGTVCEPKFRLKTEIQN